ncbi:alpha/beta hydrolase [Mammaliicoccus lentus]|uniref:alpha/beta hydrolase n=1 Tax=Mammaliicoccus lentus TaxID=42858 RepID=UPI001EEDEF25|nr:alpha/beta hydrolase-fold protein [Mammaliicoccus lentus]
MQEVQKILWNGRLLTIALPEHYEDDNSDPVPFHTVIVQDGSYLFDKLVEEYPSNVMFVGVEPIERNREYTPWIEDVSGQHYGGEAEQYLDLLEFELIPYLKERYHIFDESEYLTIGGGSFGALLSIFALVTRPHLFGKYLVMSASMCGIRDLLIFLKRLIILNILGMFIGMSVS